MSEETFARRRSSRVESSLVLKRIPSDDDVFLSFERRAGSSGITEISVLLN